MNIHEFCKPDCELPWSLHDWSYVAECEKQKEIRLNENRS